jgi:hypothetical protein
MNPTQSIPLRFGCIPCNAGASSGDLRVQPESNPLCGKLFADLSASLRVRRR